MSISKLLKSNNLIFFVIALILMGFAVHSLGKRKNTMLDSMVGGSEYAQDDTDSESDDDSGQMIHETHTTAPQNAHPQNAHAMNTKKVAHVASHVPKPVKITDPKHLLPKGGMQGNRDLINAGRFMSQQSEVLRNANLQIRSDPPVGKAATGPWNGTTIGPDTMRPQFELGGKGGLAQVAGLSVQCPMWDSASLKESTSAILPPKHKLTSME
jgi:hypothetical protein